MILIQQRKIKNIFLDKNSKKKKKNLFTIEIA